MPAASRLILRRLTERPSVSRHWRRIIPPPPCRCMTHPIPCGAGAPRNARAGGALRRDRELQRDQAASGTKELPQLGRSARADGGLYRTRLICRAQLRRSARWPAGCRREEPAPSPRSEDDPSATGLDARIAASCSADQGRSSEDRSADIARSLANLRARERRPWAARGGEHEARRRGHMRPALARRPQQRPDSWRLAPALRRERKRRR